MKKIGVYIHIPFCKKKCFYCDFVSFSNKDSLQEIYINSLKKEIENFLKNRNELQIETVYIGGGTPSYIDSKNIFSIWDSFSFWDSSFSKRNVPNNKKIEKTIEVNPGTVTKGKLEDYKNAGINRLSIGLQSANNKVLEEIGRIHTYEDFLETYNLAKEVGFENINVDLMIGIPNQTIEDVKESLKNVIKLNPTHISVYSLIVEDGTPLAKMIEQGKLKLLDEDIERNMYWYVKDFLELKGYKHYEISNFSKPGFESKHNLNCWEQKEYIGFGISAHSYLNGVRFANTSNLEEYIKNCENNRFDANKSILERQNLLDKENEYMLLGLRKIDGVSIQSFKNKFNENPIFLFKEKLNKLVSIGLIQIDSDCIILTNKGLDLANQVWQEFVE